jgi:iron complex outermembrane receptor protein
MRDQNSSSTPRATAAIALLACSAGALAQSAAPQQSADDSAVLEEITVTATRREEPLDKVPASISAFSQAQMDRQGVRSVDDIATLTPSLNFVKASQFTGTNSEIAIRGIASDVGTSTTGIYIDDLPIQTIDIGFATSHTYPRVFDLERVEVLRGPQGTLFGAGAEGGAVRFITTKPSLTDHSVYSRAELSTTKGGDASYEAGIAFGGPLVQDKLGFRLSAWRREDAGWIDRADLRTGETIEKNANDFTVSAFRAALAWEPTENLRISPAVFYQDQDMDDSGSYWESLSDPDDDVYKTGYAQAQPVDDDFVMPSLQIEYDFGAAQLISVTSHFKRDSYEHRDYTSFDRWILALDPRTIAPGYVATGFLNDHQKILAQEVRLQSDAAAGGRLKWVTGLYYSDSEHIATQRNQDPMYEAMLVEAFGITLADIGQFYLPDDFIYDSIAVSDMKQKAVFGQIDWLLTDRLTLIAGARYTRLDGDFEQTLDGPWGGSQPNPPVTQGGSTSESSFTPKLGLSYQRDDDNLYYATVAEGFRPGSAQTVLPDICGPDLDALGYDESPNSYDSDSLWSYEVGSKNTLAGGRLKIDASAYYIKWEDVQTFVNLPVCSSGFMANLGSVTSKGIDLQLQGRVTDQLTLGLATGYTDAKFNETISSASGDILVAGGDSALYGPDFTATLSGQYDFNIASNSAYARFDYTYSSEEAPLNPNVFGVDLANTPASSYVQLNARAGVMVRNLEVAVFGNNLTNENAGLSRLALYSGWPVLFNSTLRPRTFGVMLSYRL